jgi:hypothetical protein
MSQSSDLFAAAPPAKRGIGGHQSPVNETDTWLTPTISSRRLAALIWTRARHPCHALGRRSLIEPWMKQMVEHGFGTALIFARTETVTFFSTAWEQATAMLFLRGWLTLHREDGTLGDSNSGAPSVLLAYGEADALALCRSGLPRAFVRGWAIQQAA